MKVATTDTAMTAFIALLSMVTAIIVIVSDTTNAYVIRGLSATWGHLLPIILPKATF